MEKYGRAGWATDYKKHVMWYLRFSCYVNKVTDTYLEYVIHITLQQHHWLREGASISPLYVHRLSFILTYYQAGIQKIEKSLPKCRAIKKESLFLLIQ